MSASSSPSNQITSNLPATAGQLSNVPGELNTRNREADTFRPASSLRCFEAGHFDGDHGWCCDHAEATPSDEGFDSDLVCDHCGEFLPRLSVDVDDLAAL